jgi:hypothetical protein
MDWDTVVSDSAVVVADEDRGNPLADECVWKLLGAGCDELK